MAIIGRASPADIIVPRADVSARHAEVHHLSRDLYIITDLGSLNGTFVNDRKVEAAVIKLEDRVQVGRQQVDLKPHLARIEPWRPAAPEIRQGENILSVIRRNHDLTFLTDQRILIVGEHPVSIPLTDVARVGYSKRPVLYSSLFAAALVGAVAALDAPIAFTIPAAALGTGVTSWLSSIEASLEITTTTGETVRVAIGVSGGDDRTVRERFVNAVRRMVKEQ